MALLIVVAIAELFTPLGPQSDIGLSEVAAIFVLSPLALVFVLSIQVVNPLSGKVWRQPSWDLNPFSFREPLQFFHLAAYGILTQGLVNIVRMAMSATKFYVEALVPFAMAAGTFLGLAIAVRLFRSKMERSV